MISSRVPRLVTVAVTIALVQPLAGCFLPNDIIPAAILIPPAYRAAPRHADAALPSIVWWRGFRSKELTDLIEEALTSNLDIAAAALLPIFDLNASATRQRASQSGGGGVISSTGVVAGSGGGRSERVAYSTSLSASYEIDFWGKNRAALRAAEQLAVALQAFGDFGHPPGSLLGNTTSAPPPRSTQRSRRASSPPSARRSRRWSRSCGRTSPPSRC